MLFTAQKLPFSEAGIALQQNVQLSRFKLKLALYTAKRICEGDLLRGWKFLLSATHLVRNPSLHYTMTHLKPRLGRMANVRAHHLEYPDSFHYYNSTSSMLYSRRSHCRVSSATAETRGAKSVHNECGNKWNLLAIVAKTNYETPERRNETYVPRAQCPPIMRALHIIR